MHTFTFLQPVFWGTEALVSSVPHSYIFLINEQQWFQLAYTVNQELVSHSQPSIRVDTNREVYLPHTPVHRRAHLQVKCGPFPQTHNYWVGVPWTSPYWIFSAPPTRCLDLQIYSRRCVTCDSVPPVKAFSMCTMFTGCVRDRLPFSLWGTLGRRSPGCEHFRGGAWREDGCSRMQLFTDAGGQSISNGSVTLVPAPGHG